MKIIISLVIGVIIPFQSTQVIARDDVAVEKVTVLSKEQVEKLVDIYSKKHKADKGEMIRTLTNENNAFDCKLQSYMTYKEGNRWGFPAGTREKSYGLSQIHLPDHPEVTYEQATDCEFAVEFMAKGFAKGKQKLWMGYKG